MLRDVAVVRIQDGLGFAARQSDRIILRLQEAQRELEKGKTLPRFLLVQNASLVLPINTSVVNFPTGFLRVDEDDPLRYIDANGKIVYVPYSRFYREAFDLNFTGKYDFPGVAVIRNGFFQFLPASAAAYTFAWSYYKSATSLTTNVENEWLANAPEWLIGEAGWRMAMDARDKDAVSLFDAMRKSGRAACFAEVVASEDSIGPLVMGANL